MYLNIENSNYGIATTTYGDYVVVSTPDFIPYNNISASVYHTGSVDYYGYNKGGDIHTLINTITRPLGVLDFVLSDESSSRDPLDTELNTIGGQQGLELEFGTSYDLQNSFGQSVDLYSTFLIIGCPQFTQKLTTGTATTLLSGSAAYIFNIGIVDVTSSHDNLVTTIPNSFSETSSFASSVSINSNWIAIGSPNANNNSGAVYMYQNTGSQWILSQTITCSVSISNPQFGYSLKLNKDITNPSGSGKLIVGCGNPVAGKAFYYEYSGNNWNLTYTFLPDYTTIYPLTFGNYIPYNETRNISSSFGSSVSMYADTVIIGEYLDRTVYEYSGSTQYSQGSVSIFERCPQSSSFFTLSTKSYGNSDVLRSNNLGYSVDIFGLNAVVGVPKSNQHALSSCYIENTINQFQECDNNVLNTLNGQVIFFQNISGSWDITNVYQKKKKYLSPYRMFGSNVSIADASFVVGAPILMTNQNRLININTTESKDVVLDDINGKSYVYNLHNLQSNFHIGNSFYQNGKLVIMTSGSIFENLFIDPNNINSYTYDVNLTGQQTIYEKQIICNLNVGEFNVSTNPTSITKNIATFDLNSNGEFDYNDLEILMRYMKYKNNQALQLPYSTDWSSSVVLTDDENSLLEYYKSNPAYNNSYLNSQLLNYIQTWDFVNTSIQTDLDLNGDNVIDIRDMNILWKYFSNRLTQKNYNSFITSNSSRQIFSQVIDYLDNLSGEQVAQSITPEFFNYKNNINMDRTGSYLSPMITTIGLYNDLELIAIAKLGTPIKNDGILPLSFAIKIDF